MTYNKKNQCKTKGCNNPVLDGKYCLRCKQVSKENKNKGIAVVSAVGLSVVGYAVRKGALKQVPKIAKTVAEIILRG